MHSAPRTTSAPTYSTDQRSDGWLTSRCRSLRARSHSDMYTAAKARVQSMPRTPSTSSRRDQPSRRGLSRKKSQMPAKNGASRPTEVGVRVWDS
jgi:hypothetical protein